MKHLLPALLVILAACSVPQTALPSPSAGVAADGAPKATEDKAKQEQEELAQKEKELQQKVRELEYSKVEGQTGEIDRRVRTGGAEQSVAKARIALDKATKELTLFRSISRQNQIEQKRISVDRQTQWAEEKKDELAQLEAMYQEEEFAKATKELVLKRSRAQLSLAERDLAIARKDLELLDQHTLPDKERELGQAVREAELALQHAQLELEKANIEVDLAARKLRDRQQDLERDIAELRAKVGKEKS